MARIAGVDIPNDKRVVVSLTYVYGIGLPTSKKILAAAGVSEDIRVKDLTSDQEDAIRREVDAIKVEGDLRREVNLNIKRLMEIGSYRGIRHRRGLLGGDTGVDRNTESLVLTSGLGSDQDHAVTGT